MNVNDDGAAFSAALLYRVRRLRSHRTVRYMCSASAHTHIYDLVVFIVIIIHVAWQWKQFNRTVNLKWHLAVVEVSKLHRCAYKIVIWPKTDKPESFLNRTECYLDFVSFTYNPAHPSRTCLCGRTKNREKERDRMVDSNCPKYHVRHTCADGALAAVHSIWFTVWLSVRKTVQMWIQTTSPAQAAVYFEYTCRLRLHPVSAAVAYLKFCNVGFDCCSHSIMVK